MPVGAPHACSQPGCPALVPRGEGGRCPLHARKSATVRGYDAAWRRLRLQVLTKEPLCRLCAAEGRVSAAEVVDHIKPISAAPELRLEPSNLRPLCKRHHDLIVTEGDFGR